MAKTQIPAGYIAANAITATEIAVSSVTPAHLHTTLDLSSKTLTIGATTVSGHLIPDTNITYDLGSSTYRFRDIYLDGNTINLGGTELKKNDAGDIEFKSGSNFKKLVISELEFDDGTNRKKIKIDSGKIKTFDSSGSSDTADKISLAANKTDDLGEGTTNLYFTNERVDDRVNSLLTAGTGITLTYDDANNTLTIAGSAQYGDSDARSAISVSGNALSYNSSTGVITANYEESPTFTGTVTSGAILSTQAGNNDIEVRSVGDYFPSLTIARTGGTTKTNYEWNLQIGSDGYLNFKDITNGYYPLIFRNNGDVYLGNNTSAASPVLLLDQSAASATFSGNIVVSGTVDGRDIATDGTKLDGIESGATADQTQSDINALGITAIGLSGTPNITVGTINSGTITTTGDLDLTGTSDTADEKIILPRGGHIAFYGNGSLDHAISSMGTDDIRINSYGEIILNLDSNNNNTVDANFRIVKHGGGSSAGTAVFSVDGENGNVTATGTLQATSFSDGTISGITFIDEDSFATNSATRVPTQQSIKAYVDAQVAGVVDSAPAALNTLNELAAALGDDANFATTTSTALGNRLRVDTAAQGLTGTQQDNAITNLGITATKAELNVLDGYTGSVTELNYLDTLHATGVTATEFDYLDGVTSNIQTQLNAKLPLSGGTMSGNIAMANYNITGVNQLEINDPGEGIVFKSGSSGDMQLRILDDSSDNILQYSGTGAIFDVQGDIRASKTLKAGGLYYPEFNTTGRFYLGNNDWSEFATGSSSYSATHQGMSFSGSTSGMITCRLPIDPSATYRVTVRVKHITTTTGSGKFYFGVNTLNEDFSTLQSDTASSYNYGVASSQSLTAGSTYTFSADFSGYNATTSNTSTKFDPEGKYFDLIYIINYQGSGETVIQSVEVERISEGYLRADADNTVSKQLTFPSAIGDRPILQGGFLSRLSSDGDADIWGISEDYYPSQGTASSAWGIRWASSPNEIQFVGANANKLRIDLDTAGKVYIDNNEVWHAGNDGSGSGLDADLLDGKQPPTNWAATSQTYTTIASAAWDLPTGSSVFSKADSSGGPGDDGYWFVTGRRDTGGGYSGIYTPHNDGNFYVGYSLTDSNPTWYEVWTSGSDGSGSGLDADLLDGQHGSYYAPASTALTTSTTFGGDVSGAYNNIIIADDSHNHIISNVDGLQAALDAKLTSSSGLNASNINSGTIAAARLPSPLNSLYSDAVTGSAFATTGSPSSVLEYQQAASITDTKLAPSTDWYNSIRMGHGNPYSYYSNTIAMQMTGTGAGKIRTQLISNNNAQGWRTVWDSSIDGSGSGLDADLLDGIDSGSFLRSDADDTASGSYTFTNSYNSFGNSTGSVSNDGSWNARVNIAGSSHARFDVKSVSDGIITTMYSHTGHGGGKVGTYSNHPLYLMTNASVVGTLATSGSLSTTAQGTLWGASNDGAGSGLDADMVDGLHKDYLMHYKGIVGGNWDTIFSQTDGHLGVYEVQNTGGGSHSNYPTSAYTYGGVLSWQLDNSTFKLYAPHTGQLHYQTGWNNDEYSGWRKLWDSGNDGSGSGLDADLLDGQQGSYYAPTASPTFTGTLTNAGNLTTAANQHTMYTPHGNIQIGPMNTSWAHIYTDRSNFYFNKQLYVLGDKVWNAGNDGSGSGLDADLLDGYHASTTRNAANTIPIRDANGYLQLGWINTTSGDSGIGNDVARIYCSHDAYLRYLGKSDFKVLMGLSKDTYDRRDYTTDANYHTGVNAHGSYSMNDLFNRGSGFIDVWSSPAGRPPSGTHFNGFQALHYSASTTYHHGMQMVMSAGNPSFTYLRGWWANGGSGYDWQKIWTDGNDGSGSGLDADTVDGIQGATLQSGSLGTDYYVNALYHDDWVRNHYNNNGHYWSATGWHLYVKDAQDFYMRSGTASNAAIAMAPTGTVHGYVYVNSSNEIGFLNNGRSWTFKVDSSGNCTATGNVTAYSDIRLKEDIKPIENALLTVTKLEGVSYTRKATGKKEIGFVAQDVKKIIPELVEIIDGRTTDELEESKGIEDLHVMKYQNTVALLVEAIKEQQKQIEKLTSRINDIEKGE